MHDLGPAAHELTRLVNGVRDDQLGDPTPCPEYTLGDLLQHVRGLAEAFTLAGLKQQPSGGSKPPPQGDASLLPEDWREETAGWLGRLVETWSDPAAWDGTTWIAGFEAPAWAVGVTAANELVVHGWDVARAIGEQLVCRRGRPRAVQGVRRDDVRAGLRRGPRRRIRAGAPCTGRGLCA